MRSRLLLMTAAAAMFATACGAGDTVDTEEAARDLTPTQVETTASTTTSAAGLELAVTEIEDVVYMVDGDRELLLDVYAPQGEGPFPVAVIFHGVPSSKSDAEQVVVAGAAAEAGMVVLVPNWRPDPSMSPLPEDLTIGFARSACALAFAQEEATTYGGDPGRVVTYGFSAGSPGAVWLALGHGTELPEGCVATEPPLRPVGAVLGDSEYFLHSEFFQRGFDTDPDGMLTHGAALVDPATWPDDLSARFRLWSAEEGTRSREFEDPWAEDGWLAQRDPDGTIRTDLDVMGVLEDGMISFVDEGILLTARLQEAGQDATHDIYPGGHGVLDKVPEMVAYLLDAASAD